MKEIYGTRTLLPDGRTRVNTLMLFDLDSYGGPLGAKEPGWRASSVPDVYAVPADKLAMLDGGTAGFVLFEIVQRHGETDQSLEDAIWLAFEYVVPAEVGRVRRLVQKTGEYDPKGFVLSQ